MKMKIFTKFALALVAAMTITTTVFAGGPMTNSNQSASFLRSIARGTSLDPDAVYNNPAGVVFMDNGFHIGINDQMAKQTRTVTSTFAPFAMSNGNATKEYVGEVFSPTIPSVHFAWKHNRWAVMVGMGVNGGGGSLEFDNGLASFERQFSVLPGAISQLGQQLGQMNPAMAVSANRYSMDMYLKGNSMTLAFNAGVAFRITDWLSVAAQLRYSTTSNGYEGYMKNIQINPTMAAMGLQGDMMSAAQFFTAAGAALGQLNPALAQQAAVYAAQTADHILDVKQKGTSISPVLALAFHKGKWDASVKYEFKMATELEIESAAVSANDPVINGIFPNGATVKSETPALLAVAVSRHFGPVKVTAEWHDYFDKKAENSFSTVITGNTMEYLLGAEWTLSEKWLVSAGVQRTALDLDANKYSDMNFATSSTSIAAGLKYQACDLVGINLGIMPTLYDKVTAKGKASGIDFTDVYHRTSLAWGIGLDFKIGK